MAADLSTYSCPNDTTAAVIAAAGNISPAVDLGGLRLMGIVMPATWTTAAITFKVSADGGATWNNLYDSLGAEVSISVAASGAYNIDPAVFAHWKLLKVRSGTSGTPVTQSSGASITLVLRSV